MAVTFDTLKPDARIFLELSRTPLWWKRFKEDPSLYIEVRKDNQVNVYFEGGSIARIHYCSKHKKLQIFTHHKYLGLPAPSKNSLYVECSGFIDSCLDDVLERIKTHYSQKGSVNGIVPKEKWSEKYIQGTLIVQSRHCHIDSEFAYIDGEANNRIDFVKCSNGILTFVELKRMNDSRMLHETDATPEVVFQMNRYKQFIQKYSFQLLEYYQKLYDIKMSLGLPIPKIRPTCINPVPELLIFDCWEKNTKGRDEHRRRLCDILKNEDIQFTIKSDF
ncbi:hypothetical protein [Phocaeicola abscessus]|uniref:hypothetical protein n=1 Tax=Phocaeicola abscessus TaxID=555313 RepID=UPI0028E8257C|nr:hypothetical protein [Phocaeicola abscessus]